MRRDDIPIVEKSTMVFDAFASIKKDELLYPSGERHDYYSLITKPESIAVVAVTKDGALVLTEEYRHPTGKRLLSCPGGFLDEGETPEEGAIRELMEETGYSAEAFQHIGTSYPYPGMTGQRMHFFRAVGAYSVAPPQLEPTEVIYTVEKEIEEVHRHIRSGGDIDGVFCTALFFHNLTV
jgi:ADP-ribose pyrophosphatase